MSERTPTQLLAGKYELIQPLGAGGMATVWRGRTHGAAGFTRNVAVKRVRPELTRDAQFAALFVEEARVSSDLQHPNVVQIHDFGRDEQGEYFIVMEWIDGIDLGRWARAHRQAGERTPWALSTRIGIEVLDALAAAHERAADDGSAAPVIHRDVTPGNILLGRTGFVKLADFGVARAMDRATMTKPGVVKGKLSYMAPEIMFGHRASARSDIYGVGIVLWETLAGRSLFTGESDVDVVMRVREGQVPPLAQERPDVPPTLGELVHCALSRDADDRFASAREMSRALGSILRDHPEPADAEVLGRSVREMQRRLGA